MAAPLFYAAAARAIGSAASRMASKFVFKGLLSAAGVSSPRRLTSGEQKAKVRELLRGVRQIETSYKIEGIRPIYRFLDKSRKQIKNPRKMLRKIGERMIKEFNKQMLLGVSPEGHHLEPIDPWTRIIRKGLSEEHYSPWTPLHARGDLRRGIHYVAKKDRCIIKFRRSQRDKAMRMLQGLPGWMPLKRQYYESLRKPGPSKEGTEMFRTGLGPIKVETKHRKVQKYKRKKIPIKLGFGKAKTIGHVKIKTKDGWATKEVRNGFVWVHPQQRSFFHLSKKYKRIITQEANRFLNRSLWARV